MITIKAVPTQDIFLGRVGENERLRVAFDVEPYLTEYPGASFVLLNQGPEDAQPYPCAEVALDGTTLYWIITSADVHAKGRGQCVLNVTVDGVTAKSITYDTMIMRSLTGTGAVPPEWAAWLETFAEYKADAETAATEAEAASAAIQDMSVVASTRDPGTGATVGKFVDPETGAVQLRFGIPQGAPGVSPEIYVHNIEGGHRVIIIRADGTSLTFDVMDGANGADGATGPQGEPGFSPTVQVTDITGGHQVAITDLEGTHTFDVMDGEVTQEEFDELKSAVTSLEGAVEELESGSLSALGASEGQVPIADGEGEWAWGDAPGGGGTVTDVQVNGVSVLDDGVANVPVAGSGVFGVFKLNNMGIAVNNSGEAYLQKAGSTDIKAGSANYKAIVPNNQHESAFYALAKAAGDSTQSASANAVGTYTDAAKSAIQSMLGILDMIAPKEDAQASTNYSIGEAFCHAGALYKATTAITSGDAIVPGTNCTKTTLIQLIGGN